MVAKVGIPRTLAYYLYFPMWKYFFQGLGVEVVLSSETTREIIDAGVKETVNDACVPIKLFHGHVKDLQDRVDYLFIPRLVSLNGEHIYCPKFLGLPDMIRSSMDNLPPLIDTRIDMRKGRGEHLKIAWRLGRLFTRNPLLIYKSLSLALQKQKEFDYLLWQNYTALEALIGEKKEYQKKGDNLTIALLGYPYIVYDPYITVDLLTRMRKMGVTIKTAEMVSLNDLNRQSPKLKKDLFWTFSSQVTRAAYHYYEKGEIEGMIHLTAFGCGPDFLVDKLMELEGKKYPQIPFMTLTVDEHTGEAGLLTRVEAFIDMIRLRRRPE